MLRHPKKSNDDNGDDDGGDDDNGDGGVLGSFVCFCFAISSVQYILDYLLKLLIVIILKSFTRALLLYSLPLNWFD